MLEAFGWLGNVLLISGLWMAGKKWRHAFLLTFLGEAIWTVEAFRIGRSDIIFLCVVFTVLAGWNWLAWGKEKK